jgi:hypothetical protein
MEYDCSCWNRNGILYIDTINQLTPLFQLPTNLTFGGNRYIQFLRVCQSSGIWVTSTTSWTLSLLQPAKLITCVDLFPGSWSLLLSSLWSWG